MPQSALNLDREYVNSLIVKDSDEDRRIFEEWLSQPIEMHYLMRLMPPIYLSYDLPTNINTEEEAVNFVVSIIKKKHNKCLGILSRKEKVYIAEDDDIR